MLESPPMPQPSLVDSLAWRRAANLVERVQLRSAGPRPPTAQVIRRGYDLCCRCPIVPLDFFTGNFGIRSGI